MERQHVFLQNSLVGIGSNIAAVVAIIRYAMCLTTAKFTDRVNVEITLKKKKNPLSNKGHSALWYFGDSPGRHELIGTN